MKIKTCVANGQGSCKRCSEKGVFNSSPRYFLYEIEGIEGIYCLDCVKEVLSEIDEEK